MPWRGILFKSYFPTLLWNSSNCESPCCLQVQPPLTVTGTNKQTLSRVGENLMYELKHQKNSLI